MRQTAITTAFMLLVVACGGQQTAEPTSPASSGPVTVLISSGGFADNMLIAIDEYQKEYPDREVQVNRVAHEQLREKALTDLATGSGSLDVAPVELPVWLQEMQPLLEPLQPYIDASDDLVFDDFLPPEIPAARYPYPDGEVYALPMRQGVDILHYRADLFDAAGITPPTTLDEVVSAGLALKRPGFYPLTLHLRQGVYGVQQWLITLHSMGGSVLSRDLTEVSLGEPAVEATQWLMDLIYEHEVVSPSDLNAQIEDVVTNMQKGAAAFGIFSSANIYELEPDVAGEGGEIAYSAPPHGPGVEGGAGVFWAFGLGISKDSPRKDAAWHLIQFIASYQAQVRMALEAGNGSPLASVYQSPEVMEFNKSATATMDALRTARPKDPHPKWAEIEDVLASEISLALAQRKTAEEAIADATTQIETIIGE